MNNQIQLVLKSSTTELSLNDRELGIYLTPELDGLTGLPEIRTTSGVNAGYDGGWTSAQNYDARSITIRGVIANEDVATVEQLRRQLTTLAGQGKNEELTLDLVTQAGKAYTIQVRTIALEMSLQKVLTQQEFMLQLRADDPLIYDASETGHEALLQVAQATGGFTIDFELPLAITGSSEETIVNNEGLEQVPTITRMYGALHNPKIINQTTNQFMQIEADLGFAEGDWIEPSEVVSGKDITINGAPEGAPLSSVQIDGETSQQTYSGKNLCSGVNQNYWLNAAAYSAGQTTGNSGIGISVSANTDYTISTKVSQARYRAAFVDSLPTSNTGVTAYNGQAKDGTSNSITINSGSHGYLIVNATSLTDIQIEVGSSATSFEPYVGGVPAPNPDYPQAVQTVTGEQTITICGKNLAPITAGSTTIQQLTISIDDNGVITLDGSTTNSLYFKLTNGVDSVLGTSIQTSWSSENVVNDKSGKVLSIRYISGSCPNGGTAWRLFNGKNQVAQYYPQTSNIEAAYTAAGGISCIALFVGANLTYNNYKVQVQLEEGSTATTYEPYQDQSYEVNLGKNLYDKLSSTDGKRLDANGGEYTDSTFTLSAYIPVEPNTKYTLSGMPGSSYGHVATYDSSKTFVGRWYVGSDPFTFTTQANARYIRIATPLVCKDSTQCERGSQATSYAAYFEPIELCKIGTYQDYIYKSGGKWYVRKEIGKFAFPDTGWAPRTDATITDGQVFRYSNYIAGEFATGSAGYSSHFRVVSSGSVIGTMRFINADTFGYNVSISNANTGISSSDSWETKAAKFNAWCSSNSPVCYYVKATPTDTEITNEALVAQLEALAAATMHNPQTNITTIYAGGNEQGTLSISYFTDKNPDTRDELVIDSRLRTITLNGLDVYHLQAPGSEFLMLAPGENRLALQSDITGDNGYAQVSYKQGYLSI